MSTRSILTAAALVLALSGIALLFLPDEVASLYNSTDTSSALLVQQLGIALLGGAVANWTARGLTVGGIYGRAIVAGNLMYFGATSLLYLNTLLEGETGVVPWINFVVSGVFAVLFSLMIRGRLGPAQKNDA